MRSSLVALPFQVYPIHQVSFHFNGDRKSFINSQRDTLDRAAETWIKSFLSREEGCPYSISWFGKITFRTDASQALAFRADVPEVSLRSYADIYLRGRGGPYRISNPQAKHWMNTEKSGNNKGRGGKSSSDGDRDNSSGKESFRRLFLIVNTLPWRV